MAAYYPLRRPSSASRPPLLATEANGRSEATPSTTISPSHSIYIFPNPPSTPPSPLSPHSSVFSVPTDYDSFSDARSRTLSNLTAPTASTSDVSAHATQRSQTETDVEIWDLSTDPEYAAETSDTDESWVLEAQVAQAIDPSFIRPPHAPARPRKLSAPPSPSTAAQHHWLLRPQRRPRAHSRARTLSSLSSLAPPAARRPAPHPRIHLPLLSLFSSLLAVDPDDPAMRLLTHAEPDDAETLLFPGHTPAQLLSRARPDDTHPELEIDLDAGADAEVHGLPRLLLASLSDHSTLALRSLREGLAVYAAHAPESALALPVPGAGSVLGLWRVVEEVCARSSQAWKEVWGGPPEPDAGPIYL